ncbi:MAG TPA: response regulator [Fibrobacteria bacterium]|nr:response regulator [Fibrobacteria bacterium]
MNDQEIHAIFKDIVDKLAMGDPMLAPLPEVYDPGATLSSLGLDLTVLPEVKLQLEARLGGKTLDWDFLLNAESMQGMTLGPIVANVRNALETRTRNPILVYVDDEEENLFVFKRRFEKKINLRTFSDPLAALNFIRESDDVTLVVTDEVMPNLGGNALCDEVHRVKPNVKFVLITGNPNQDEDLMYRALRRNRFYEFIQKPLDLEKMGAEYEALFQKLLVQT